MLREATAVRGLSQYFIITSVLPSLGLKLCLKISVSPVRYKLPEDRAGSDFFLYSPENLAFLVESTNVC